MVLTQQEWDHLNAPGNFPRLVRDECTRTAPEDGGYNCISWFLGLPVRHQGQLVQQQWVDPPPTVAVRNEYATAVGYVECDKEDIRRVTRLYSRNGYYLHGDRWNTVSQSWESKMGACVRMLHREDALEDQGIIESFYGNPTVWYRRVGAVATSPIAISPLDIGYPDEQRLVDQISSIAISLNASYTKTADMFDRLFAAWKATWFTGRTNAVSQNSQDRAFGLAWDALVLYATRVNVLPQIVQKLSQPENVFGVHLYNAIQTDPSKKVNPRDTFNYYFLKNQAAQIQKLFGAFIQEFTAQVEEWEAHQESVSLSSNSADYLDCPAYENLVDMGISILPLAMERYARDKSGWWHELLYHIANGRASGSMVFIKEELFEYWKAQYDVDLSS